MAAFFEKIAPLNNAQKITKPLFVVQGGNDPRVPLSEAEQMVERVKQNSTPVWYLMAKDEGHGFAKKKQRRLPVLRDGDVRPTGTCSIRRRRGLRRSSRHASSPGRLVEPPPPDAPRHHQACESTLATASAIRCQFSSSAASCFLPALVSS